MKLKDFWRWADEDENGCLIWQQHKVDGYGIVGVAEMGGVQLKAHRVAWYLTHGDFPPNGLLVLHKCDVRSCVNPDHLFSGTNLENIQDRVKKGRTGGWRDRKLTKEQVQSIAPRMKEGESVRSIARSFGVSHTTLFQILRGETYTMI